MTEPRESRRPGPSTVAVHGAPAAPRPVDASVVGPVHRSTTFPLDERGLADVEATGGAGTWYYGRLRNPTNARVAAAVAALEGAPAGEIFASGMAAIGTTLTALVPPGGRLVAAAELYGDTRALLEGEWAAAGRRVTYVDVADLDGFARALAGGADALLVEALSNPMLRVADLPRLAALAHAARRARDRRRDVRLAGQRPPATSTASTPSCTPRRSTSTATPTSWPAPWPAARRSSRACARSPRCAARRSTPAAPTCSSAASRRSPCGWTATTPTASRSRRALRAHPDVAAVAYPFLDEHPDAALARRLLAGGSGMVTITVAGDAGRGRRLLGELRLIAHATSLGGVESIACLPVATSHAAVAEAERLRQGIEENTVRLSLGIEDADDLVADLEGALHRSARAVSA